MTRKRWADLRDEHLAKLTPEGRARYEQARKDFEAEMAEHVTAYPEDAALWDFVDRGNRAQAAVDQIINQNENGVVREGTGETDEAVPQAGPGRPRDPDAGS